MNKNIDNAKPRQNRTNFHTCHENMTQLEEAFRGLDVDGDGVLSTGDISSKMLRLGIAHSFDELAVAVREIAGDDTQEVDLKTLIPLATYQCESEEDLIELRETFKVFDKNGDGYITTSELKQVFADLGDDAITDEQLRMIFSCTDVDKDGLINFDEFRAIWSSCCHQTPSSL